MAVIPFTANRRDHEIEVLWSAITEGDTAAAFEVPRWSTGVLLYVSGTFGGASVAWQGSVDGTNFISLPDSSNTLVAITAAGGGLAYGMARYLRPAPTGGSSQSLNVQALITLPPERSA